MAFLDENGVLYFWQKIKNLFATKAELDVVKESIADAGGGDMIKATYDTNGNGVVDNAEKVNGFTVGCNVPAGAKFTDTVTTVDSALNSNSSNPVQNKIITAELQAISSDLSNNYAKKSDITGVYKYKGSVDSTHNLPTSGNTLGDVYNVDERGINYAWNGTQWDALGEVFIVPNIPNARIDEILAD